MTQLSLLRDFFFQAEDGIRDRTVTGVQTCALPILSTACDASLWPMYRSQLINSQTDWDELDTGVNYIRGERGVEKVALASWSQGSFRIGPYAIQHPDKVQSLLVFAPIFNTNGRESKAAT